MLIRICVVREGMYKAKMARGRRRTVSNNVLSAGAIRVGHAERVARLVTTITASVAIPMAIR